MRPGIDFAAGPSERCRRHINPAIPPLNDVRGASNRAGWTPAMHVAHQSSVACVKLILPRIAPRRHGTLAGRAALWPVARHFGGSRDRLLEPRAWRHPFAFAR
jgi:hypothetical protein